MTRSSGRWAMQVRLFSVVLKVRCGRQSGAAENDRS